MSGNLTIPNIIGTEPGPTVLASKFDNDWAAIASYVNVREVTVDVLANRPAPGVKGRWYVASDANQGFVDTGVAWQPLAGGGGGGGIAGSLNQHSNAVGGSTAFTLRATLVATLAPNLSGSLHQSPADIVCDISVA